MHSEIKYHGVYRGKVVATNDPENFGRVTLKVPQVSGQEVTNWAWPISAGYAPASDDSCWVMFEGGDPNFPLWMGSPSSQSGGAAAYKPANYGSFYHTANVLLTSATTAYPLPLNTTAEAVGVSIASSSRITVANAGVYNIQFSAQLDKTDNQDDMVNIWFAKNGTNIDNSNTQFLVQGNNGKHVASWNFVLTLAANDYVQIMFQSPDTNMRVIAFGTQTNPARPAVPSAIVTVTQVR